MLKSHERFHSKNGKRLLLIADDEFVNREILRNVLQDEYELVFAANGQEALEEIRKSKDVLSLVLLDLLMPVMSGMEVLQALKADPELASIPVIVITSDQDAEVESLSIGATDFIPKPYPQAGIILARVRRAIELSEDRLIIGSTERDELTGLYNREYFYRYAEQYDQYHEETDMDAIVVDINHFHLINERFGTAYGDEVLRHIADALLSAVHSTGGIVCRREADTFMVYCPHGQDYEELLNCASVNLGDEEAEDNHTWLRMGVYENVDKMMDIERRFDRAQMAADTVQGSFTKIIGIYDIALHEKELYSEQLIEDFATAVKEQQFQVFYQPKFDVQPDIPVLVSAEALVRWQHPQLGMVSPGAFIPLFEENGLIQRLDIYVWRQAAAQIKAWKQRFDIVVPVSVNVSRVDMYDPHLADILLGVLEEFGLSANELLLEITESAYMQDSEQIIETVNNLRNLGFQVEMDDFGTGYSSLNMISSLPIDALKLDMQFIRSAFAEDGDTRMIEIIIDIADYLSVPVIAEGVETEEQLRALRAMGCDRVQGYYFSRPVPAEEYEKFVEERNKIDAGFPAKLTPSREIIQHHRESAFGEITHALSSGFEAIFYIDTDTGHYVEFSSRGKRENLQIEDSGSDFFAEVRRLLFTAVHPEDEKRVSLSMCKAALLPQLIGHDPFYMTYRIIEDGQPVYYNLKAIRALTHDDHHIVIGISNINGHMHQANEEAPNELSFSSLAKALSSDMESIYYVDVDSDTYSEFNTAGSFNRLNLQLTGTNFFDECRKNIARVVYREDQKTVSTAMQKHVLIDALQNHPTFSMTYRLTKDEEPVFYNLKAVWASEAAHRHIIIGVSNVDAQISDETKLEAQRRESTTYESIVQALAKDYFAIYYVNVVTGRFIEYDSHERYQDLGIEKYGEDFFGLSRKNIQRVGYQDDLEMFLSAFTKENILAVLERDKAFTLTYRLMLEGKPTYVHIKAIRMEGKAENYAVFGVSDVNEQMCREQEHARLLRMANQDALTGVKTKHLYEEDAAKIDRAIQEGTQVPFALAICDVNDLKRVNDTQGHIAGDQLIKDACAIICRVFDHSPVYRIGGDEFVAILRGEDYNARDELMEELRASNHATADEVAASMASGLAVFDAASDEDVASVFARADASMYANKKDLKRS